MEEYKIERKMYFYDRPSEWEPECTFGEPVVFSSEEEADEHLRECLGVEPGVGDLEGIYYKQAGGPYMLSYNEYGLPEFRIVKHDNEE